MPNHPIKARDFIKPPGPSFSGLETGTEHVIIVGQKRASLVEFDDGLFLSGSPVLLPRAGRATGTAAPSAIELLALCLGHAGQNTSHELLCAGHAEEEGAQGIWLSEDRAAWVLYLLCGRRDDWSSLAHKTAPAAGDADRVQLLDWVADLYGWPCSPALHDGDLQRATRAFQESYNKRGKAGNTSSADLALTGQLDEPTWGALFDCHQDLLATASGLDRSSLKQAQAALRFVQPARRAVGCGDAKPVAAVMGSDGSGTYRSGSNRRVEVLFFEPGQQPEHPCVSGVCTPGACELLDGRWYLHQVLVPEAIPEFSVEIDLPETLTDADLLQPLELEGTPFGTSRVRFDIEIASDSDGFKADRTVISVRKDGAVIYSESHGSQFGTVGEHEWFWNGYDQNSVLDTTRLKGRMEVVVQVFRGSVCRTAVEKLDNEAEDKDWVDVHIDLSAKTVLVTLRVDCQNEDDMDEATFLRLRQLLLDGLAEFWSRRRSRAPHLTTDFITVGGTPYDVTVQAVNDPESSMDFDLYLVTDPEHSRSNNFIFWDATVYYNIGWNQKNYPADPQRHADEQFRDTAAHEFGHTVLYEYDGLHTSATHKGTSNLFSQKTSDTPPVPATGEIDLMHYHLDPWPHDFYQRRIAAEEDVKGLIWMARVDFDEE